MDELIRILIFINPSSSGQNDRHSSDDIFKRILLNEKVRMLIKISLKIKSSVGLDNSLAPNRRQAII